MLKYLAVLGIFILLGTYFMGMWSLPGAIAFTPIFCAEYEYKCCSLMNNPEVGSAINSFWYECPSDAHRCELRNVNSYTTVYAYRGEGCYSDFLGKQVCNLKERLYTGDSVLGGQRIVAWLYPQDLGYKQVIQSDFETRNYVYKLLDCGFSPCAGSGVAIGSGNCQFAGDFDKVYDKDKQVKDPDYEGLYTVPRDECYLTTNYANRRICGYLEEECSLDSDCAKLYPYKWTEGSTTYGATCSQNMLTLYGCVKEPGGGQCIFIDDVNNNRIHDQGEACLEYSGRSYCSAIAGKTIPVQCCPDSTYACAANAVCNPQTFRCEETRECSYDWQCEAAGTSCDFNEKKLKVWGCLPTGQCGVKTETDVECCYDTNCPYGYFCDKLTYKCYESPTPKPECDRVCCVNDGIHRDKPCPSDQVCCPGGMLCANSLEECGVVPPIPGAGDLNWIWIIIIAALIGAIGYKLSGMIGAVIGAIIGGILGYIVYWWLSLPWWGQLLLSIGIVGGGAIIMYVMIFGGGLVALAVVYSIIKD